MAYKRQDSIQKDIVDLLTPNQLAELDEALKEADRDETISWDDFKKELVEWRKRAPRQEIQNSIYTLKISHLKSHILNLTS